MAIITHHICIDIKGFLEFHRRKKIKHMLHDDGRKMTDQEARDYLYECLSEGKKVLPFGEPCEGFDYQKGCPGHPKEINP